MTAPIHATRAQALEDAIRQAAQVAEGVRESYSAAESLDAVLGAVDVLMERVRTAPREDAADMGAATLDPNAARICRAALKLAAKLLDDVAEPMLVDGIALDPRACLDVRRQISAGVARGCERRAPAVEIGDEGAVL